MLTSGVSNPNIDAGMIRECPDLWTDWLAKWTPILGEGNVGFYGNPDGDRYDNLIEYAFCLPPDSGVGTPFCLFASESVDGGVDGVFFRTLGGPQDVDYYLEWASALTLPTTSWTSVSVLLVHPDNITVDDNGDGTETVRIIDLETITELLGGSGFVRIRVDLVDLVEPGDPILASSTTDVHGWVETAFGLCCQTYNNPFLQCSDFTGTVDLVNGVVGRNLNMTNSAGDFDLATVLASGVAYYIEVLAGDNEGQRFDVASASGSTITLAPDGVLFAATPPFNTLTTVPADLAGDLIVLRRHWTLDQLFNPSGFNATNDPTTADQVQVFAGDTLAPPPVPPPVAPLLALRGRGWEFAALGVEWW